MGIVVIILMICLLLLTITAKIYENNFGYRGEITHEEITDRLSHYPKLTREKEEILTKEKIKLIGYWYNKKENQPIIVFSQGIGTRVIDYINEINYFATNGYTVFAFDNTGCGESEGKTIRGLPQSVVDLDCVLSYIENLQEYKDEKIFLYGHSWGGFAVCAVNNFNHRVSGVVERSGFNSTSTMIHRVVTSRQNKVAADIINPFVKIYEFSKFGKYAKVTAVDGINSSDIPVMIMHSYDDEVVPYEVGIANFNEQIINSKVEIKTYEDRNHTITHKDSEYDYETLEEIKNFFDAIG